MLFPRADLCVDVRPRCYWTIVVLAVGTMDSMSRKSPYHSSTARTGCTPEGILLSSDQQHK